MSLTAAVIPLAAGYFAYSSFEERQQRRAITAAVKDTTARLREALPVAPGLKGRKALDRLQAHEVALEARLREVRRAGRAGDPALADGAEHYVLGAREILRRQAASIRQSEQAAASRAFLVRHMRRAARRDGAWIREAMLQKKIVEAHYFDYNLTLTALADLLQDFPGTAQRLAPHLDERSLLPRAPAVRATDPDGFRPMHEPHESPPTRSAEGSRHG